MIDSLSLTPRRAAVTVASLLIALWSLAPGAQADPVTLLVDAPHARIADDGLCSLPEAILNSAANSAISYAPGECLPGQAGADRIVLATDVTLSAVYDEYDGGAFGLPSITSGMVIDGAGYAITRPDDAPPFAFLLVAAEGDLTLHDLTLSGGQPTSDEQGAITAWGRLDISRSQIAYATLGLWLDATEARLNALTITNTDEALHNAGEPLTATNVAIHDGGRVAGALTLLHATISDSTLSGVAVERSLLMGTTCTDVATRDILTDDPSCGPAFDLSGLSGMVGQGGASVPAGSHAVDKLALPDVASLPPGIADDLATDLAGNPRPLNGLADYGALESDQPGAIGFPLPASCAEVNEFFLSGEPYLVDEGEPELDIAIKCANSNGNTTTDVIELTGNIAYAAVNDLSEGRNALPAITSDITLRSDDAQRTLSRERETCTTSENQTQDFRFAFVAAGGSLTLENLVFENGCANGGGGLGEFGGAVLALGDLTIIDSSIQANTARSAGALGIAGNTRLERAYLGSNAALTGEGGAIFNVGTLTMVNSTVALNSAVSEGGGFYNTGALTMLHVTIVDNSADSGAAFTDFGSTLRIDNTLVAGNSGAACRDDDSNAVGIGNLTDDASCDADWARFSSFTDRTFVSTPDENSAIVDAASPDAPGFDALTTDAGGVGSPRIVGAAPDVGAIEFSTDRCAAYEEVWQADGTPSVSTAAALRVAMTCANLNDSADTINLTGPLTLDQSWIAVNGPTGLPDVTSDITLNAGTLVSIRRAGTTCPTSNGDPTTQFRIAHVAPEGILRLNRVGLENGCANGPLLGVYGGGALVFGQLTTAESVLADHRALFAGAIGSAGTVTLDQTSLANNAALTGSGGAVYTLGTFTARNSTFAQNSAATTAGGLYNGGGAATLTNVTLHENVAGEGAGVNNLATLTLRNALISDACANSGTVSGLRNLTDEASCAAIVGGDVAQVGDLQLGPLQDNGGPTETIVPLETSPAINYGRNDLVFGSTDQRGAGFARIVGARADVGAAELQINICDVYDEAFGNDLPADVASAAEMVQAVRCAGFNDTADTIRLGATIPFESPADRTQGANALPIVEGDLTIDGQGQYGLQRAADGCSTGANPTTDFRFFYVAEGATLTLDRAFLSGGCANAEGLGIFGGAILAFGNVTLQDATLRENEALNGGALAIAGRGTIRRTTFAYNEAFSGDGGALFNLGPLSIQNSTFSGNVSSNNGGALFNLTPANTSLLNVSLVGNVALNGAGLYEAGATTLSVNNTYITGGSGAACSAEAATLSGSGNLSRDDTCPVAAGFNSSDNIETGGLSDNGGDTLTHALIGASQAVDAGTNTPAVNAGLLTDQRGAGFSRFAGGDIDVGSFEADANLCTPFESAFSQGMAYPTSADPDELVLAVACALANSTADVIELTSDVVFQNFNSNDNGLNALPPITRTVTLRSGDGGPYTITRAAADCPSANRPTQDFRLALVTTFGSLTLDSVRIENFCANGDGAGGFGGAILNFNVFEMQGTAALRNNTALFGGGGLANTDTARLNGGTLANNVSRGPGGGIYNTPVFAGDAGRVEMRTLNITGNRAEGNGGGLYSVGTTATVQAETVVISENSATNGGGFFVLQSAIILNNSVLTNNAGGNCGSANGAIGGSGTTSDDGTCPAAFNNGSSLPLARALPDRPAPLVLP